MNPQATLPQIRDFFGMTTQQLKVEWQALSTDEKEYFKDAVGATLV